MRFWMNKYFNESNHKDHFIDVYLFVNRNSVFTFNIMQKKN